MWLQFEPNNIDSMHKEFKEHQDAGTLVNMSMERIEENRPCLCLFPTDSSLYRAIIVDVNYFEGTAKVLYVDFGNTDDIEFSE